MLKKVLFFCVSILIVGNSFANDIYTTIEINEVVVNKGLVYAAICSNEKDYKSGTPFTSFILEPDNTSLTYFLELPEGEYVVSVFQDSNNDGKLNTIIFGIPTEPVGITNYNLRGAPGGFNISKVPINNSSTKLIINIGRVKPLGII